MTRNDEPSANGGAAMQVIIEGLPPADPAPFPNAKQLGGYYIHPAAEKFPLLTGDVYQDLRQSISRQGQLVPIVVRDGVLLDGRNRLRACLERGIKPLVREDASKRTALELIYDLNIVRRDLTVDQCVAISADLTHLILAEENAKRQREAGAEGGRGHKKNLSQNSGEGFREAHERSTAGRLAAQAQTSRYKAEQAIAVRKHAPELVEALKQGTMPLTEAARQARAERATVQARTKPKKNEDSQPVKGKRHTCAGKRNLKRSRW